MNKATRQLLKAYIVKRAPPPDVDDLVQKAMIRLWRRSDRAKYSPRVLAFFTARSVLSAHYQSCRLNGDVLEMFHVHLKAIRPHVDGIDTESDDVLRITSELPTACRPIMALRLQGYTREEIAARLKIHPESVHNRLKEINRRLALLNSEAA